MSKMEKPSTNSKQYWRSLDQLDGKPEFRDWLEREFPRGASEWNNAWSRRSFITLMGASVALAGLASCRRPEEKIVPIVKGVEGYLPGVPKMYATTMPFGETAYGLLVDTRDGRPTKTDGNESHPSTRGGSNQFIQASILGLYDPDRAEEVREGEAERSFDDFVAAWLTLSGEHKKDGGASLAVISEAHTSPTMAVLTDEFKKAYPNATWATWEPVSDENIFEGVRIATGSALRPNYETRQAKVILSLDADFCGMETDAITSSLGFIDGRRVESEKDDMNRLYVVESGFSITGGMADHRLRVPVSQIGKFTIALAHELKSQGVSIAAVDSVPAPSHAFDKHWLKIVASDLIANRGAGLVMAGRRQPAAVHALIFAINTALQNTGKTIIYRELNDVAHSRAADLKSLASAMDQGKVTTVLVLGSNPVLTAPADLNFGNAIGKVSNRIVVSSHRDETAKKATWHIPQSHFLECWGDARSSDGTVGVIQPMIRPLFNSKSNIEVLSVIARDRADSGHELVRERWQKIIAGGSFESKWRKVLHDGLLADSATKPQLPSIRSKEIAGFLGDYARNMPAAPSPSALEVSFSVSTNVWDGRFTNNGWLQELPDPVSKVAWDNIVAVAPSTAKALVVGNGDVVQVSVGNSTVEGAITVIPGQCPDTINLELGYGRRELGRVADGSGFNVYPLRSTGNMHFASNVRANSTGQTKLLANTQDHNMMEGRPIVREASLAHYREHPEFAPHAVHHPSLESMWDDHVYAEGPQWGMTIDLNACTGCGACTIACQSENNIPIVGREQVHNGREMHWMRIDRYYTGDVDDPEMVNQPVQCQHCEMAPCEQVCPVAATTHTPDGLNAMVYNRCIGTRYCSNNCPYKVRKFNFFNYTNEYPDIVKMAQNPQVTVRSRGVMEKCTYCVQRISAARITAKKENRDIQDGEVMSACQVACPTKAIMFGDVSDPDSKVSQLKKRNLNYELLKEYNTRPRTSFLAKLRNPHPELAAKSDGHEAAAVEGH